MTFWIRSILFKRGYVHMSVVGRMLIHRRYICNCCDTQAKWGQYLLRRLFVVWRITYIGPKGFTSLNRRLAVLYYHTLAKSRQPEAASFQFIHGIFHLMSSNAERVYIGYVSFCVKVRCKFVPVHILIKHHTLKTYRGVELLLLLGSRGQLHAPAVLPAARETPCAH
jgi:hypothetical protein